MHPEDCPSTQRRLAEQKKSKFLRTIANIFKNHALTGFDDGLKLAEFFHDKIYSEIDKDGIELLFAFVDRIRKKDILVVTINVNGEIRRKILTSRSFEDWLSQIQ